MPVMLGKALAGAEEEENAIAATPRAQPLKLTKHDRTTARYDVATDLFTRLDTDRNGFITREELRKGLTAGTVVAGGGDRATVSTAAPCSRSPFLAVPLMLLLRGQIEMRSIEGGWTSVPITAKPGIDIAPCLQAPTFLNWASAVDADPKLFVQDIHLHSVDMFGPSVGFIKFEATAKVNVGGEKGVVTVPGIVFMRGGAVGVLVILECEGKEYTILTRQARVPVARHDLPELPAGMLDGSGKFKGVAAEELEVRCSIKISEDELVDLTELAYGDSHKGIIPSGGGCDEFIRLFVCRRVVKPEALEKLQGRLTGSETEGGLIKLNILPVSDMWQTTPDAKALCAVALFNCLRAQGTLPESVQKAGRGTGLVVESSRRGRRARIHNFKGETDRQGGHGAAQPFRRSSRSSRSQGGGSPKKKKGKAPRVRQLSHGSETQNLLAPKGHGDVNHALVNPRDQESQDAQVFAAAQIFDQLDADGSGTITKVELRKGLSAGLLIAGGDRVTIDMAGTDGTRQCKVPITAEPGIDLSVVLKATVFLDWVAEIDADTELFVQDIHVQSVDMFGPNVGFIKLYSTTQIHVGGEKGIVTVPGIVFMRGGSVGVLVILECEGKEYTILTRQARVPMASHDLPEIPAGMLDGSGHFKGAAAQEIIEECNIEIAEDELVDLTELAYGNRYKGIIPSGGGSDEFIRLFVCRRAVKRDVLSQLQGRLTGLLSEGEVIKLQIILASDMWLTTPDAKALCALALFNNLRAQGMLPESVHQAGAIEVELTELVDPHKVKRSRQTRLHRARAARAARRHRPLQRASDRKIEDELNLLEMDELKRMFFEADRDGNGELDMEEFVATIGKQLAGKGASREQLIVMFRRMDANMDNVIGWDEFSDYMLLEGLSNNSQFAELDMYQCLSSVVSRPDNCRHSGAVTSMAYSSHAKRYFTAAPDATIRVWNDRMQHQKTVQLADIHVVPDLKSVDSKVSDIARTSIGSCVGLAVAAQASQLVAATTRSIAFFDLMSLEKIDAMPCLGSPHCVDTWVYKDVSWVGFGDDMGYIHLLNPVDTSVKMAKPKKVTLRWSSEQIHTDWVNKISFVDDIEYIITCSNDGKVHMLDANPGLDVLDDAQDPLPIKHTLNEDGSEHARGVRSFVWCKSYKILATCGIERYVALWNRFGQKQGELECSGLCSVEDLAVNDARNQLFTITSDDICRVWDLTSSKCIQVCDPFYIPDGPAHKGSKRDKKNDAQGGSTRHALMRTMHFNQSKKCVVLGTQSTGCIHANCMWRLKSVMLAEKANSHSAEVSCIAVNMAMHQVISCDVASTLSVWDLDSGDLSWSVDNAHGKEKISAVCVETTGTCLLTGGAEGRIKMWNLSNGRFVKEFVKAQKGGEVTQLYYRTKGIFSTVVAVGWDKTVTMWADDKHAGESFASGGAREVRVIGLPNSEHNGKTGCIEEFDHKQSRYKVRIKGLDGAEDTVIALEEENIVGVKEDAVGMVEPLYSMKGHSDDIRSLALGDIKSTASNLLATGSDDGEIRIWSIDQHCLKYSLSDPYQGAEFDQKSVEQLVFLASGVLVSCGSDGFLRFWAACEPRQQLLHRQKANHRPGESILTLSASSDGEQIVTADSGGYVKVHDVSVFNGVQSGWNRSGLNRSASGLNTPMSQKFRAGKGAVALLHMKCHEGAVSSARFVELQPEARTPSESRRPIPNRSDGQEGSGFIVTASTTGEVLLWTWRETKYASAGALVGQFIQNKSPFWKLNEASTFESKECTSAVDDEEVARTAEWEARSDYPTTGVAAGDFLQVVPKDAASMRVARDDAIMVERAAVLPGARPARSATPRVPSRTTLTSLDAYGLCRAAAVVKLGSPRYGAKQTRVHIDARPRTSGVHKGLSTAPHGKVVPQPGRTAILVPVSPRQPSTTEQGNASARPAPAMTASADAVTALRTPHPPNQSKPAESARRPATVEASDRWQRPLLTPLVSPAQHPRIQVLLNPRLPIGGSKPSSRTARKKEERVLNTFSGKKELFRLPLYDDLDFEADMNRQFGRSDKVDALLKDKFNVLSRASQQPKRRGSQTVR